MFTIVRVSLEFVKNRSYAKVYFRKTFQNWSSTKVYAREILQILQIL